MTRTRASQKPVGTADRNIKGKAAVVGVGASDFFKYGGSPDSEFVLTLKAILAAVADAGLDPKSIDGFVSYSDDRNTALRVANALGVREMRWATMQWGGGGGGASGAVQQAAAATALGFADTVVVYRGLAQGEFGRFGVAAGGGRVPGDSLRAAYGVNTPAELVAARMTRFMHDHGIAFSTQEAVSLAAYYHAQRNPRAVMRDRPLTKEKYEGSRWIVEPWRLYDYCQESDGAAAVVVTNADRARELTERPAYLLGAAMGSGHRAGGLFEGVFDPTTFATAEFKPVARRLYEMSGLAPHDVDVVQSYENFTGGVVMSLIEHGFCAPEDANEFMTFENFCAPGGKLPLNTSGGNLAEGYIHGFGLIVEAVRQIRGESVNQVPDANVSLVSAGPMFTPASTVLFGSEEALA
jgi:acetyl-CoA acetyltransferase